MAAEMNTNLIEKWSRSKGIRQPHRIQADVMFLPQKLNSKILEYYEQPPASGGDWITRSELPTSAEIMDRENTSNSSSDIVELAANKPAGPFASKEEYLSTHYELLREDALRPLREAVTAVRERPAANEDGHNGHIGIYEKVHICGITMSTRGIASRITFSLRRAGKQILWPQSKRLISGSLVVLTPVEDMFQEKAIVAVVAARPIAGLEQNPPEIDLLFQADELEVDPALEYIMIEDRGGLYEADRHTLLALQHMMAEPFPLSEHLVAGKPTVATPKDVLNSPKTDMTSIVVNTKHETYENFNVLKQPWPQLQSSLDESQLAALCQILTKRLAIIQGPPGTGKTHVSVEAIKVMIANRTEDDPPIVVACQTNHAIDQILRHILEFEEDVVRLGGRSKDPVIKKRTLYEVRQMVSENPPAGNQFGGAKLKMKKMTDELALLLTPLQPGKKPLDHHILASFKIISQAQANSLESGASSWVQEKLSNPNDAARSPFIVWLGDKLVTVPSKQLPEDFGFDFEETDLEFEQLREVEAENSVKDDDGIESLSGTHLTLADNFTCRKSPGEESKAKDALKQQDMWKIPDGSRAAVYRYLQRELKQHLIAAIRAKAKEFNAQAKKRQIGSWERDEPVLKRQKVVGMTTTGFSKYRGLIAALGVKIILIEEAAETLEAPVTVTCIPTLQQLILVGDHLQLRPHCHVKSHEDEPWNLNISMFERLVNNGVEHRTLLKQRRMIPEIRRLLFPIYKDIIKDHPSVTNPDERPNVSGMGGINTFFFTHNWSEQRDDTMSVVNPMESDMIVNFVEYLVYNGTSTGDITILTFYNGQRKRILKSLREKITLGGCRFNVVTVDSYQGEENKVVLLSLARSNENKQIGFLNVDNRICVALSRAQCGFYIFGNGKLLYDCEDDYRSFKIKGIKHKAKKRTWTAVMKIMQGQGKSHEVPTLQPHRLDIGLPLRCSKHNHITVIKEPEQFEEIYGGCKSPCGGVLPCGHQCLITCHPFSHDMVKCATCPKESVPSNAATDDGPSYLQYRGEASHDTSPSRSSSEGVRSRNSFSTRESARVAQAKADHVPLSQRPSPEAGAPSLNTDVKRVFHGKSNVAMGFDGTTEQASSKKYSSKTVVPVRVKYTDRHTASATTFAKMPEVEGHVLAPPAQATPALAPIQQNVAAKKEMVVENLIDFDD